VKFYSEKERYVKFRYKTKGLRRLMKFRNARH
jgi:hypothetical protein